METRKSLPSYTLAEKTTKLFKLGLPLLGDDPQSSPRNHFAFQVFRVSEDTRGPGMEEEALNRLIVGRLRFPRLSRPTVGRLSLCRPTVGRHRLGCRPTVQRRSHSPRVALRIDDLDLHRYFVGRLRLYRSIVGRQGNILDILLNAVIFLIFRKKLLLFFKKIRFFRVLWS